jgi:hypothetical protein
VVHRPTRAIFAFYPREDLPGDAVLTLGSFDVHLIHVCGGHVAPWGEELALLYNEAVVMGLFYLGVLMLNPAGKDGDRSERQA